MRLDLQRVFRHLALRRSAAHDVVMRAPSGLRRYVEINTDADLVMRLDLFISVMQQRDAEVRASSRRRTITRGDDLQVFNRTLPLGFSLILMTCFATLPPAISDCR